MGYTHYWTQKKPFTKAEWSALTEGANAMITGLMISGIPLVHEYDDPNTPPTLTGEEIHFNGLGEEGGHETFLITRKLQSKKHYPDHNPNWNFCKTAEKPYDLAVTCILAYLDSVHPEKFVVSSDGRTRDWEAGVKLARLTWPPKANIIGTPRAVVNTDRYAYYEVSGGGYQIAIGHDRVIYIERCKDLWRIALTREELTEFVAKAPHDERTSGSFSGDQYEKCRAKFCKHLWRTFEARALAPETFQPLPA